MAYRALEVRFTAERKTLTASRLSLDLREFSALSIELNGRSLTPVTHPSLYLTFRVHDDISPLLHTSLERAVYFDKGTYSVAYSFVQINVEFLLMICPSVFRLFKIPT